MADPDNRDGVVILVGVKTDVRKAVRVNVTFAEDVLEQIDRFAHAHGYTRSGFLARCQARNRTRKGINGPLERKRPASLSFSSWLCG